MNSTSCILLITLLVIVVVGVCMSHPAGKAGMSVGCLSGYDCENDDEYCVPFDANGNYVKDYEDGAAGICAPKCDENDAAPCNINGVCAEWVTDKFTTRKYCYPTAKQPCTTACTTSGDNLRGGKAGFTSGQSNPGDGKVTNLLTGGQHRTGGKAGFASYPGDGKVTNLLTGGQSNPGDGKVTNLLTGGQHRTGGKAGMAVGNAPKPKSNCQTDQDCPGYDGSSKTMCITNAFINGVNVCTPKCVGTDPESCGFKGRCESVMPFIDGEYDYYYCNAKDKKHPCTESCYNANRI